MIDGLDWTAQSVLITGGTGSLGSALVPELLRRRVQRLVVLSRDEAKQHGMRQTFGDAVRFFLGDVRDPGRLSLAFRGVDIVIHAAALKQQPAGEYSPDEFVLTNVIGTRNVVRAAIDAGVRRVMTISTDKVGGPTLYGATKHCCERLTVQGNSYAGAGPTRLACTRYGNVVSSRGSVIPVWQQEMATTGAVTLTDPRATRFLVTLPQAVEFVLSSVEQMHGGEVFIPELPAATVLDLAEAVAPGARQNVVGLRPYERLHEVLISCDEAFCARDLGDRYALLSPFAFWGDEPRGTPVATGFEYRSDTARRLGVNEIRDLISPREAA